jgi:hypothetical protein
VVHACKLAASAGVYLSDGSRHSIGTDDHGHGRGDCRRGVFGCRRKHRPQIFRFLLSSTRDVDLAETLTQECFLKAHRNWASFRGESSAMTWLMRIAINLQKDHWRNRRMQFWRQTQSNAVDLDEASEWLPSGERSVEQQLLARERVGQVRKAVERAERAPADGLSAALRGRDGVERDCAEPPGSARAR